MFNYPAVLEADDALDALHWAADQRGFDYRMDSACQYVLDGEPRCIVGVALDHLGIDIVTVFGRGDLESCGTTNGCSLNSVTETVTANLARVGVVLSSDCKAVLGEAQSCQDAGRTWGEAVACAYRLRREQTKAPF